MHELRLALDPVNPGQFYACCGLLELANGLHPGAAGHFVASPRNPRRASFVLATSSPLSSADLLEHIRMTRVQGCPDYPDDATRPLTLTGSWAPGGWPLDWWLNPARTDKTALKLWAGQQTSLRLMETVLAGLPQGCVSDDLFEVSMPLPGRFGFDPRSSWNAQDCGYSPNDQSHRVATYVLVEVLAAVGLETFSPGDTTTCTYALWNTPLEPLLARAVAAGACPEFSVLRMQFHVGKRAKYGYFNFAREMTNV